MTLRDKTSVFHWRYEDGWEHVSPMFTDNTNYTRPAREFREEIVGWHCWVYPIDDREFEDWMTENMKGKYDCTYRFNSGNPMWTVIIKEDQDATLFRLRWM